MRYFGVKSTKVLLVAWRGNLGGNGPRECKVKCERELRNFEKDLWSLTDRQTDGDLGLYLTCRLSVSVCLWSKGVPVLKPNPPFTPQQLHTLELSRRSCRVNTGTSELRSCRVGPENIDDGRR